LRIGDLIKEISVTPLEGIGKPEPLKYEFNSFWRKRVDQEHLLIYAVSDVAITIIFYYSYYQ